MNWGSATKRGGLCLLALCASTGSSSLPLLAQQTRTTQEGVFTNAQATRGAVLYEANARRATAHTWKAASGPSSLARGSLACGVGSP